MRIVLGQHFDTISSMWSVQISEIWQLEICSHSEFPRLGNKNLKRKKNQKRKKSKERKKIETVIIAVVTWNGAILLQLDQMRLIPFIR